jgi:DNA-binding transcriptional MocR family regulator
VTWNSSKCIKGRAGLDVETGFLQVDTDGRVIRVDSFSKILAPGLRLAWVTTTPKNLVHCLNASFMPTLGPSTMSQGLAFAMLEAWGFEGFEQYIKGIQVSSENVRGR